MVGTKKAKKNVNTEKNQKGLEELIIIETNKVSETEKVKKLLDRENIKYKVRNPRKSIEEVVKAFDRASIKY